MTMRFGLAALVLLPFLLPDLRRITRSEWRQGLGLALTAGPGQLLQTIGLNWTDASIAAFLTQLYTLWVPLVIAILARRAPTRRVLLACAMVLSGVAALHPGLLAHLALGPGEIVLILSSFCFTAQIIWVELPSFAPNRAGVVTFLMFALIGVFLGLVYLLCGGPLSATGTIFGQLPLVTLSLVLVLCCTALNFYVMNRWQRLISATEAGLIYCLEPVVATLLATVLPALISRFAAVHYPNERLGWNVLLGGGLIVSATILVATGKTREAEVRSC
jgi:drug/metabolite transporter (DMT)-like permease